TARQFIAHGINVIGNGHSQAKLDALRQELGPNFFGVAGDASEENVQDRLFSSAQEQFGQPASIVVVNAGRGLGGSVKDADLSRFEAVLNINLKGALSLMQKAARQMVDIHPAGFPNHASDIIILGSVVGRSVSPFSAIYGATKFAIHSLAESLRREIGPRGVRVSLIEPGIVLSGFQEGASYSKEMINRFEQDFGPLLKGQDIAQAIHFIVSQPAHIHVSDIVVRPTRQDYP
ncbi:MAG: SDR family oxidoreductase, partial [Pseudomonadota bacterium]|nr:SDR family oxidoreductase [Pseudomonadota bacterium]